MPPPSFGLIPTGITKASRCDSNEQCEEWGREGLACQQAKGPYGKDTLKGKYCCLANDSPCQDTQRQCCNMDCDKLTKECSAQRVGPPVQPGTGISNQCKNSEQCVGYPERKGLLCQKAVGWDDKVGDYCCISEGNPCNPKAKNDECCNILGISTCDKRTNKCVFHA